MGTVLECVPVINSASADAAFPNSMDITWGFPTIDFDIITTIS